MGILKNLDPRRVFWTGLNSNALCNDTNIKFGLVSFGHLDRGTFSIIWTLVLSLKQTFPKDLSPKLKISSILVCFGHQVQYSVPKVQGFWIKNARTKSTVYRSRIPNKSSVIGVFHPLQCRPLQLFSIFSFNLSLKILVDQ